MATKEILGIRVGRVVGQFTHLHVSVMPLTRHDLLKEMESWLHNEQQTSRYGRFAHYAKQMSGSSFVYRHGFSQDQMEVVWLAGDHEWIAPKIESCYMERSSIKAVRRVLSVFEAHHRRPSDLWPEEFVNVLIEKHHGMPVKYHNDCDGYLPNKEFDMASLRFEPVHA